MLNHVFAATDIANCPDALAATGALITIEIRPPKPLVDALVKANKSVPPSKTGTALIDTGATLTTIHEDFIKDLGVKAVGAQKMTTPSGGENDMNTYPLRLLIPSHNIDVELPETLTANLEGFKTTDDKQIIALVGRDFLSSCVLIYNGHLGMYTLAS